MIMNSEKPMKSKPIHYKVVRISLYTSSIEELDAKVAMLKTLGWTKANRSHLIRLALDKLDDEALAAIAAIAAQQTRDA